MDIDHALLPIALRVDEIDAFAGEQDIAEAVGSLHAVKEWHTREWNRLKGQMLVWCLTHGDLTIGSKRYYAGIETETKCRDVLKTLNAFLEVSDLDTLAGCLSANAWKPGACRKSLPGDIFKELFSVEVKNVLADGKPRKTLIETNDFFKG